MSELAQLPTPAMATRMVSCRLPFRRDRRVFRRSGLRPPRPLGARSASINRSSQAMSCSTPSALCSTTRAGVGVELAVVARSGSRRGAASQLGPPALEEGEAGLGRQVTGERQPQREAAGVVGGRSSVNRVEKELPPGRRDPVDLARPPAPRTRCAAGPASPPTRRSASRSAGRGPGRRGALDGLDRAARLQAGERRVDRAERDVGEEPELVAEPPAHLVAVHAGLLVEEARGGPDPTVGRFRRISDRYSRLQPRRQSSASVRRGVPAKPEG